MSAKARGPRPLAPKFWSKVRLAGDDECWQWLGTKTTAGYGQMSIMYRVTYAHRVSWEMHNGGVVPDGKHVLHRCDDPGCVNPRHLFLGTNQDNINDKLAKGRQARGAAIKQAKLNDQKAREIRSLVAFCHQQFLADFYGVSQAVISRIVMRENYRHVQ